jgi:hypothetical protein
VFGQWHGLRYGNGDLNSLDEMRDDLLDHVAARALQDPTLSADPEGTVLRTAAECALGVLSLSTLWVAGDHMGEGSAHLFQLIALVAEAGIRATAYRTRSGPWPGPACRWPGSVTCSTPIPSGSPPTWTTSIVGSPNRSRT